MSDTQNSALYKGIGGNFGHCALILLNEGVFERTRWVDESMTHTQWIESMF